MSEPEAGSAGEHFADTDGGSPRVSKARHAHSSPGGESALGEIRRSLLSESAVYGVILVSSLIIVSGRGSDATWELFFRVFGSVIVFWIAHVFATFVANVGASAASGDSLGSVLRHAALHSIGLVGAALIPLGVIMLGALGILDEHRAVWTALWVDVGLLGFLGYIAVARHSTKWGHRFLAAGVAALLGLAIMALKAFVH